MAAAMSITTLSAREFNQDASKARRAARDGPVFITDRGRPAHVLLTFEDYEKLTRTELSLAEALAGPPEFDFDFEPPRLGREPPEPADFD
jgi:prevent-host-death family protein